MEHAHRPRQREEVRVGLDEHALDLVELTRGRPALLLRRLGEALSERREDRELPVRHRLELDLQGQHRRRRVDLHVLRAQVPEFVREHDRPVVRAPGRVTLRRKFDVCGERLSG